jgi:hypothetical protein
MKPSSARVSISTKISVAQIREPRTCDEATKRMVETFKDSRIILFGYYFTAAGTFCLSGGIDQWTCIQ